MDVLAVLCPPQEQAGSRGFQRQPLSPVSVHIHVQSLSLPWV